MSLFHPSDGPDPTVPVVTPTEALADHAMGIELQLLEIAVRRGRAEIQGDMSEAHRLDRQAEALQAELGEVGLHLGAA